MFTRILTNESIFSLAFALLATKSFIAFFIDVQSYPIMYVTALAFALSLGFTFEFYVSFLHIVVMCGACRLSVYDLNKITFRQKILRKSLRVNCLFFALFRLQCFPVQRRIAMILPGKGLARFLNSAKIKGHKFPYDLFRNCTCYYFGPGYEGK